jgi:hypothetical protein
MVLTDLERTILSEISREKCWAHVEWLAGVGEKLSGTATNEKSVDYVLGALKGYGVDAAAPEFQAWLSFPKMFDAELKVLEPERRAIECISPAQINSTPTEGVGGELVYVGGGGLRDYEDKNVRSQIVLVDFAHPPARPWKNYVAGVLKGAIGQIVIGYTAPRRVFNRGTVKSVWGNPTPETIGDIGRIPVVLVAAEDGLYLKGLLEKGPVRVWMRAEDERGWARTRQPMATIRGSRAKFVLLGSHMDAWGGAASCNAVGCASTLETARVMKKFQSRLLRGLELLWFQGHETGIMTGSTWYVDSYWDNLHGNCSAYLNNDTPCMINTTVYTASGDPVLRDFLESTVRDLAEDEDAPFKAQGTKYIPSKTGDQSFYGLGIPSARVMTTHPPELAEEMRAPGGWWYHSDQDTIDKVDPETLYMANKAQILVLFRLCTLPVLPFRVKHVVEWMLDSLGELDGKAMGAIDLKDLVGKADRFRVLASRLDEAVTGLSERCEEQPEDDALERIAQLTDDVLLRICRALNPVNYTLHGRYEQDHYGAEYIRPIPVLQPVSELTTLNPDTSMYKAKRTKLVRARNAVYDALEEAIWLSGYLTEKIEN